MPDVKFIEEGKYKIQTVGPEAGGVGKATGKPWRTFDLQFEGDGTWYNTFWSPDKKEVPQIGEELSGKKEYNETFKKHQFNQGFGGNKANWNPAASNAAVMSAAVAVVNGFLGLKPEHLAEWEGKRKKGQTAVEQYLETIKAIGGQLKKEVIAMGGNEMPVGEKTAVAPPKDGDPGPTAPGVENWTDEGESEVELGPM